MNTTEPLRPTAPLLPPEPPTPRSAPPSAPPTAPLPDSPVTPGTPDTPVTPTRLRSALGQFATGVTIVTCLDEAGVAVGLTANSFNALSLDPPLVLWSLRLESPSLPAFAAAGHFIVNVLAADQLELSRRFAKRGDDKFAAGDWEPGLAGVPRLAGCAAVLECEAVSQQTAGDHMLFIGRVQVLSESPHAPLVYQAGHYHGLGTRL